MWAGDRFIIYLSGGISMPELRSAERIRSLASLMLQSGKPIMSIAGSDLLVLISIDTIIPSIPLVMMVLINIVSLYVKEIS
jgi:hypothetical protein